MGVNVGAGREGALGRAEVLGVLGLDLVSSHFRRNRRLRDFAAPLQGQGDHVVPRYLEVQIGQGRIRDVDTGVGGQADGLAQRRQAAIHPSDCCLPASLDRG